MESMYFFTALDSQYLAHTPRDPLGFQVVWVAPARKIIPHLSTVSTSARDFQILSYAKYFCSSEGDTKYRNFNEFFYRFEQACGYARYIIGGEKGFNGTDRISQRVSNDRKEFAVSGNPAHSDCMLMSNQRNYGIYGKYNRPYTDMKIDTDPDFHTTMTEAFEKTGSRNGIYRLMRRIFAEKPGEKIVIHEEELKQLAELIMTRSDTEQTFFTRKILQGDSADSLQRRFFDLMCAHPDLLALTGENWNFHGFIERILELTSADPDLNRTCIEVQCTEKVLYPLWSVFAAFLNNRPFWQGNEIDEEAFFSTGFSSVDYAFPKDDIRNFLNSLLDRALSATERLRALVKRNREVSERRGGLPWVREDNGRYIILAKGARPPETIEQHKGNVNGYFLPGYLHLFHELVNVPQRAAQAVEEVRG